MRAITVTESLVASDRRKDAGERLTLAARHIAATAERVGAVHHEPLDNRLLVGKELLERIGCRIKDEFDVGATPQFGRGCLGRRRGRMAIASRRGVHPEFDDTQVVAVECIGTPAPGFCSSRGAHRLDAARSGQPLDLAPRCGDIGRSHVAIRLGHEHERLVTDLIDKSWHAFGHLVDGVVAAGFKECVPCQTGGRDLSPQIGECLRVVEGVEVSAHGNPLGEARLGIASDLNRCATEGGCWRGGASRK